MGNSRLAGVATEPRHAGRALEHQVIGDLDAAFTWAADACDAGEYSETLLPAWLWAIEKAKAQLEHAEDLQNARRRQTRRLYDLAVVTKADLRDAILLDPIKVFR